MKWSTIFWGFYETLEVLCSMYTIIFMTIFLWKFIQVNQRIVMISIYTPLIWLLIFSVLILFSPSQNRIKAAINNTDYFIRKENNGK